ncbi:MULTISPECIES: DUF6362 family protein [unclassified Mesorhizobium]|uniref:DUF6362 family protein n=1 Tax=unclassified Mesorhizobium TaxID=325217 RepID=UPI00112D8F05|nr:MULTISPECIES: DUF6362 family protein [unclassified Mesorhizobium]TPJ70474.1 hypothetical protein FJ462_07200 [Mesorhizobium sp. B2-6-7]TPJ76869.1 hypothetical protein FJ422_29620 [Mesorhizobium sp. B2-6-3]
MTYRAWTAKAVEDRVIEAAETLMLLPNVRGPQPYGSAMPTPVKEWEAYGSEPSRYKSRPSRDAIDRMPETWGWINAHPDQSDRVLLYSWAWVKTRRGRSINDFASREGVNVRTLRRQISRICQDIAGELNRLHVVRLKVIVDPVSEITAEVDTDQISSVSYANHWRAEDAKPQHLPELLDQRAPATRAG